MSKVRFTIDGKEILAEEGSNLLEIARKNGYEIPSLCHDPRLEPFGSCRLCLVEIEGARGMVQSCGAKVREGMVVRTNTENIAALRRLAVELLLSEHCGDCVAPCQLACPAGIDIQGFVAHIANGRPAEAAKLIYEKLPMPASVGRVCPRFCEKECRRNLVDEPVSICALKRFAGDQPGVEGSFYIPRPKPGTGKQVAVVGGGPAGLSAAYYLALEGHQVTIFDAAPQLGGAMRYGIPEYRLPKEILDKEIQVITDLCQNVFCNKVLGRDFTIQQLRQMGFDAVFLGVGACQNQQLGLAGEQLEGAYSGIEFLRQVAMKNPITVGKRVVVIGGGNTAMDAARTAVRLGAEEVTVVYRRSSKEMPASPHEIEQAAEEGVKFILLTNPQCFLGEGGQVRAIQCLEMKLGEPDGSGRRRPVAVAGSEFEIPADMVITATGQRLDQRCLAGNPEVKVTARGVIQVDRATLQGDTEWVFSGGDCVTGPATVVEAVAAGRQAAASINLYLKGSPVVPAEGPFNLSRGSLDQMDPAEFEEREKIARVPMPTSEPAERKKHFREFEHGFTPEMAQREANRCLSCGCLDVFSCRLREYADIFKADAARLGHGKKRHPVMNDHPVIISDPDKCVLCGNCVRICQEVQGTGALGFVNRGSQTVVLPALGAPLSETLCSSCVQCINICPTGALSRRSSLAKPGPWRPEKVATVCPHCSMGCQIELNMAGNQVVGVTSKKDLCNQGVTGFDAIRSIERLNVPLMRKNGRLHPVDWDEALAAAWQMLAEVRDTHGLDSVAVAVSPNATNEESYLAFKLGRMALGTNGIYSTVPLPAVHLPGLKQRDVTLSYEDLQNSDLILVVDGGLLQRYPVIRSKIKKAAAKGSKLLMMNPHATELDKLAKLSLKINRKKIQRLLEAFVGYLLQYNLVNKEADRLYPAVLDDLENQLMEDFFEIVRSFWVKPDKVIEFIHQFIRAKNPVIVADGHQLSQEELELLKNFALLTGNLGQPGRGILLLYPYANVHGLQSLGVKTEPKDWENLALGLDTGRIKGILVIGNTQEPDERFFRQGIKTVMITPSLNRDLKADIILPGSAFGETTGTITNSEGKIQKLLAGCPSLTGRETWQVLLGLAYQSGSFTNHSPQDIFGEIINHRLKN